MNLTNQLLQDFCKERDEHFNSEVEGYVITDYSSTVFIHVKDKTTKETNSVLVDFMEIMAFVYSKIK